MVVGTQDGRRHVIHDREAAMLEEFLKDLEAIKAMRHGEWVMRFRDAKLTPSLESTRASRNWAEEAREQSPSELEAERRRHAA